MSKNTGRPVRLFSYKDDQPQEEKGSLIPRKGNYQPKGTFAPESVGFNVPSSAKKIAVTVIGLFVFAVLGIYGYGFVSKNSMLAAPVITIVDPYTKDIATLDYGSHKAFSQRSFFTETRDAFIDEGLSFIEIDISGNQMRYFENGVLLQSAEILSVAEEGSWWEVPSGLYKIEDKDKEKFTTTGQVYLPWQLTFQGNYLIHGWPIYPNGQPVDSAYGGGGISLSDEDAEELYEHAKMGMPVLVHTEDEEHDIFVYQPQVLEIDTPHYFIADIDNSTILAASDLDEIAPIASLVKLMTAVVATEKMSLESRIQVTSPTFVTSLIPRLFERSSVSMYSLLQLLLVESSNEAAETIAGEIGRDAFIEDMNTKARQLGMMNTFFADPSGLSSENVSSLSDLFILTKYINDNKSFIFDITANKELSTVYTGGEFDGLVNFNEIKGMDSFVGGKVGETKAAGQTSISLHELEINGEKRTLAVILLGSTGRTEDVETLISYIQNKYKQ